MIPTMLDVIRSSTATIRQLFGETHESPMKKGTAYSEQSAQ